MPETPLAALWFKGVHAPAARRLILARTVRSLGQGALAVDFALYARALGWSPAFLGSVFAAGLLLGAVATAVIGPLSDRFGRKRFLLGYEILAFAAAGLALASAARWPLAAAAMLAGWGRGAVGAPALFGAVEQAWLARTVERGGLGRVFARNAASSFFGTAIGSALAALPALWTAWLPGALAYRPLFALVALGEAACFALLLRIPDPPSESAPAPPAGEPRLRRQEHRLLGQLAGLNALNGLGIGLVQPLLAWWFAQRYGVGPAAIGPAMGVALVLCGLSSIAAGWAGTRLGAVGVVVAMRAAGLVMLVLLPFAPSYPLAMLLFGLRMVLNRGTAGPRQALALGLVRVHRRGLAATVNSFSMQVPRAFGPALAGVLFAGGSLVAPFLLAAAFQAGYLAFYPLFFGAHDPERGRGGGKPTGG